MTPPKTLAQLITEHRDRTGDTYADIARAAGISRGRISQIALGDTGMPSAATVRGLATALGLSDRIVRDAAYATAGITSRVSDASTRIELITARLHDLTPGDLEVIDDLVSVLHARRSRG